MASASGLWKAIHSPVSQSFEETPGFRDINIAVLLGRIVADPGVSWRTGVTVAFIHLASGLGTNLSWTANPGRISP